MRFAIQPATLKALKFFAGKNDIRPYLNSVYIEWSMLETRAISTNGKIIGIRREDRGDENDCETSPQSLVIPNYAVDRLIKLSPKKDLFGTVIVEKIGVNKWRANHGESGYIFEGMVCHYPSVHIVLTKALPPLTDTDTSAVYNAEYLLAIQKAGRVLNKHAFAKLNQGINGSAGMIEDIFFVIMPLENHRLNAYPEWVLNPLIPISAKAGAISNPEGETIAA